MKETIDSKQGNKKDYLQLMRNNFKTFTIEIPSRKIGANVFDVQIAYNRFLASNWRFCKSNVHF